MPPCRVLYVWPNPSSAKELYPAAAVVLPIHVVVASRGRRTDIWVMRQAHPEQGNSDGFPRCTAMDTLAEVLLSLESISMRPSLV